jgi:hypothetical protein
MIVRIGKRSEPPAAGGLNRGRQLAQLLSWTWRKEPPALPWPNLALDEISPLLIEGDTASLGWWRLRQTPLIASTAGQDLQEIHRQDVLQASRNVPRLLRLVADLRGAGVEPLVLADWPVARLYPEAGLRRWSHIDLCVRLGDLSAARKLLTGPGESRLDVTLNTTARALPDRAVDDLFQHSRTVRLGNSEIRIAGNEDLLRFACLRVARHGCNRPLWLCDVAAVLESLPPEFDWDYCLSGNPRLSGWVRSVAALACRVLGAWPNHPAIAWTIDHPPEWMRRTTLWRWGTGRQRGPLGHYLKHPTEAVLGLHYHGLNPIRATYRIGFHPGRWLPVSLIQLGALMASALPRAATRAKSAGQP